MFKRVDGFGSSVVLGIAEEISNAQQKRIGDIVDMACGRILKQMQTGVSNDTHLIHSFSQVIRKECDRLIAASKCPPSVKNALQEIKEKGNEERRIVRTELRTLKEELESVRAALRTAKEIKLDVNVRYDPIPLPVVEASETGAGLPEISGIYFIWTHGIVSYVGQSINICRRVRLAGGHHAVEPLDWVSWLPEERERLNHTEAFYIGLARPFRNFGWLRRQRDNSNGQTHHKSTT